MTLCNNRDKFVKTIQSFKLSGLDCMTKRLKHFKEEHKANGGMTHKQKNAAP
jgi:hypothetical protein